MISKADIIALVRQVTRAQKGASKRSRFVNPKREWFIIITVTIIGFILALGALVWQTSRLSQVTFSKVIPTTTVSYKKAKAEVVMDAYSKRLEVQQEYKATIMNASSMSPGATLSQVVPAEETVATSSEMIATSTPESARSAATTGTTTALEE